MAAYLIRRLWQFVPTLLGVVLLVFFLFNWIGGDPAYLLAGKIANPEQIENIRRQLGVDQPYYVQLWIFIKQIATGDFGASCLMSDSSLPASSTRFARSREPIIAVCASIESGFALNAVVKVCSAASFCPACNSAWPNLIWNGMASGFT